MKRTNGRRIQPGTLGQSRCGQCRLVELGFRQGGNAGYGLRRLLRDQDGNPKGLFARGDRKSLQTDRVVLVPGPKDEVAVVREIYRRFTEDQQTEVPGQGGLSWTLDLAAVQTALGDKLLSAAAKASDLFQAFATSIRDRTKRSVCLSMKCT